MADEDQPRLAPANLAQYFGRLAQTYGEGDFFLRRRESAIAAIADEIAVARRILDLGCANGRYLRDFRKVAPDAVVLGADLTHEMLLEARARTGTGVPLIRADATALPLRDGTLDIIFASHVLQFVADKDATMRDLARCLVPGGAIILTVGGGGMREAIVGVASEEQWNLLAQAAFPGRRRIAAMESEAPHRDAINNAGLALEAREARFRVTWGGFVEWIGVRWSPFMNDEQRRTAARILDEMTPELSSRSFDLSERLLIGRRTAR